MSEGMQDPASGVVQVILNRGSVCMGDDVDSHLEFWTLSARATVDDLLVEISTHYLPSVAGPAGWCLYIDFDNPTRRRVLGLIYTRDDRNEEDRICRYVNGNETVARLTRDSALVIDMVYLTGDAARPVTIGAVRAGRSFTAAARTRLWSEAEEHAKVGWRAQQDQRRLAWATQERRRRWLRQVLLAAPAPPAGADTFVASNFHHLAGLLCNASMAIAGELLGMDQAVRSGSEAVQCSGDAAMATFAMELAAFEWGLEKDAWSFDLRDECQAYLEFLAACGYRLSPIEHVLAGRVTSAEFGGKRRRAR